MQLIKLNFLVQRRELKWLVLNNLRRLFHSSRVKLPLVNKSAIDVTDLNLGDQTNLVKLIGMVNEVLQSPNPRD